MKRIQTVCLFTFLSLSGLIVAQDCADYHQFQCTYTDYTFFYSQQSKSLALKRGQSGEVNIVAYANEDYYINVCAHSKFGEIQFRILEDNSERTVIYDNASDNFANSVVINNEHSRKLIIEVSVPPGKGNENDRRCVGVLVEFKKKE
jgi:hypothetical protein